jgi:hypothetical protein
VGVDDLGKALGCIRRRIQVRVQEPRKRAKRAAYLVGIGVRRDP